MNNGKKALIIIDMQNDFTKEEGKNHSCTQHVDKIIPTINKLGNAFMSSGHQVIYFKTEWSSFLVKLLTGNSVQVGTVGAELDNRLKQINNNIFIKHDKNIFENKSFLNYLDEQNITELYLAGLAIEYCIKTSFKASQKYKYQTYIVSDAVAAYRCNNIDAILNKYISKPYLLKSHDICKTIQEKM